MIIRLVISTLILIVFILQGCTSQKQNQKDPGAWRPEIISESDSVRVYLPDFSYAGYYWGEKQFPGWQNTLHVSEG
jgi:hypothetical protein